MQELTTPFEQHDLVWAKVQNYPWWPGKIVQIFQQKKSLFFKISFFADPTYCYFKEDDIIPFEQFRQQLNANFTIDGQLQRAIILANNTFQRNKQTLQNRKLKPIVKQTGSSSVEESQSQMVEEQPSKSEGFEQSTIHIDFEAENSNGKINKLKKATQIKNLLLKYKLDKIPAFPKQQKITTEQEPQQEAQPSESQSDQQENIELFDLRNTRKSKTSKKNNKRKPIVRRKRMGSLSTEQRRIQFMKKVCSTLIYKGLNPQISRQITVKMMEKTELAAQKLNDYKVQKMNPQQIFVKLLSIVNGINTDSSYEDKLIYIFRSIEGILYQIGLSQKEEEEKTNIIYADEEQVSAIC